MSDVSREVLFSVIKKDLVINYFSGTGGGGQHRNKHQNCVRIKHSDSGALVTGQSHRERKSNMKEALNNLVKHPKFLWWHQIKAREVMDNKTIDEKVAELMAPENIKIETHDEQGRWQ